jgi:hypothetical protein
MLTFSISEPPLLLALPRRRLDDIVDPEDHRRGLLRREHRHELGVERLGDRELGHVAGLAGANVNAHRVPALRVVRAQRGHNLGRVQAAPTKSEKRKRKK